MQFIQQTGGDAQGSAGFGFGTWSMAAMPRHGGQCQGFSFCVHTGGTWSSYSIMGNRPGALPLERDAPG